MIREAKSKDAKAIASIYNHYILNSSISFEEKPINENIIIERINYSGKKKEDMRPRQKLPSVYIRSGSFYLIKREKL